MSTTIKTDAHAKVTLYRDRWTQTGSVEANVQALVSRAFRATIRDLHGQTSPERAAAWRMAAEVATGGEIEAEDIFAAACYAEGL